MSGQIIHALRRCVASRAHIKVYNALSIRHPRSDKSLLIRAHSFEHMPYFDETRTDCIAFRASWAARYCGIEMGDYDLTKKQHQVAVGYCRARDHGRPDQRQSSDLGRTLSLLEWDRGNTQGDLGSFFWTSEMQQSGHAGPTGVCSTGIAW